MLCFKITFPLPFKAALRTVKQAQLVRALAAYPEDLSSVPRAYVVEGEIVLEVVLCPPHVGHGICAPTHT